MFLASLLLKYTFLQAPSSPLFNHNHLRPPLITKGNLFHIKSINIQIYVLIQNYVGKIFRREYLSMHPRLRKSPLRTAAGHRRSGGRTFNQLPARSPSPQVSRSSDFTIQKNKGSQMILYLPYKSVRDHF